MNPVPLGTAKQATTRTPVFQYDSECVRADPSNSTGCRCGGTAAVGDCNGDVRHGQSLWPRTRGSARHRCGRPGSATLADRIGARATLSLGDHTEVPHSSTTLNGDLRTLLDVFWSIMHLLCTPEAPVPRRGVGTRRPQCEVAKRTRDDLESRTGKSVETAIETLDQFYLAEDYHQKYELRSTPVVADELEDTYGDAFVDSTVAARLNGFVAGHGEDDEREALFAELDISPAALSEVRRRL